MVCIFIKGKEKKIKKSCDARTIYDLFHKDSKFSNGLGPNQSDVYKRIRAKVTYHYKIN